MYLYVVRLAIRAVAVAFGKNQSHGYETHASYRKASKMLSILLVIL